MLHDNMQETLFVVFDKDTIGEDKIDYTKLIEPTSGIGFPKIRTFSFNPENSTVTEKAFSTEELETIQLKMVFSDQESIDLLIHHLTKLKEMKWDEDGFILKNPIIVKGRKAYHGNIRMR